MKKNLKISIVFFLILSIVPSYAAGPLPIAPLLYQIVLNTTRQMALQSLLRKVVVPDIAEETSWISTFEDMAQKGVGIVNVANGGAGAVAYELPLDPDKPVLDPPEGKDDEPGCGEDWDSPCPFSHYKFTVTRRDALDACRVDADESSDGQAHVISAKKVYGSFEELGNDCVANLHFKVADYPIAPWYQVLDDSEILEITIRPGVYKYFRTKVLGVFANDSSFVASFWAEYDVMYAGGEEKDNVKRFKRSGDGFLPDERDPDWEEEEKNQFDDPRNVRFENSKEMLTVASSKTGARSYIEYILKLPNGDIERRVVYWDENMMPWEVTESLVKDQTMSEVGGGYYQNYATDDKLNPEVSGNTGGDTGTGAGNDPNVIVNVDTSELAKEGEAADAAEQIVKELQAEKIDDIEKPWMSGEPPDFGRRVRDIEDITNSDIDPNIDWDSFLPDLSPGDAVQCKSLEYEAKVETGPAKGLSAKTELDLCWVFDKVRVFLSWIFGVISFIYVFRSLTRSES
jgi:hypothetical protein